MRPWERIKACRRTSAMRLAKCDFLALISWTTCGLMGTVGTVTHEKDDDVRGRDVWRGNASPPMTRNGWHRTYLHKRDRPPMPEAAHIGILSPCEAKRPPPAQLLPGQGEEWWSRSFFSQNSALLGCNDRRPRALCEKTLDDGARPGLLIRLTSPSGETRDSIWQQVFERQSRMQS